MIRFIYLLLIFTFASSLEIKNSNDGPAKNEYGGSHEELHRSPASYGPEIKFTSIDEKILQALLRLKEKIPEGIPELGVPVLDPFLVKTFNFERHIIGIIHAYGEISYLVVRGFENIQIHHVSLQLIGLQFKFDFEVPLAAVDGYYNVKGRSLGLIPFFSKGGVSAEMHSIRISGSTKLSIRSTDKTLYLQYLTINIKHGKSKVSLEPNFGGVIIRKVMNMLMKRLTPDVLDQEMRKIETDLSQKLTLIADEKLKNYTLASLIKAINKSY